VGVARPVTLLAVNLRREDRTLPPPAALGEPASQHILDPFAPDLGQDVDIEADILCNDVRTGDGTLASPVWAVYANRIVSAVTRRLPSSSPA